MEYQNLKKVSGIPIKSLDILCSQFQEKFGRFPRLDELSGSTSSKYLTELLKLNKNKATDIKLLLDFTGKQTVGEAIQSLNNIYLDTETEAVELSDKVILDIKQRPNTRYKEVEIEYTPDEIIPPMHIIEGLDKLRNLYGYNFKEITNWELNLSDWKEKMPFIDNVKGFIYNGDIYINTDNAGADTPIHEMLHLLFGTTRFTNPNLYLTLLNYTMNIQDIESILELKYPFRTKNDALEELMVEELSKYLVDSNSLLDSLPEEILYEINYNVNRTLDTLLFGDYSSKSLSNIYNMTYGQVAKSTNSSKLTNLFLGMCMFDGSEIHRKLLNLKSDLIKKGELNEICE